MEHAHAGFKFTAISISRRTHYRVITWKASGSDN